ncbi:MAG: hypothetical protein ACOYL8_02855 [Patescibacteria group bacterium]
MPTKNALKPGDRFSHKDGYGYVINEKQAILMEPKTGGSRKFVYVDDIPEGARFVSDCPKVFSLAMDAIDCLRELNSKEVKIENSENQST